MPDLIQRPKRSAFVILPVIGLAFTVGGVSLMLVVGRDVALTGTLALAAWLLPVYLIGFATHPQPYGTVRTPLSRGQTLGWRLGLCVVFVLLAGLVGVETRVPPWAGIPFIVGLGGFILGAVLHGVRQWRLSPPKGADTHTSTA